MLTTRLGWPVQLDDDTATPLGINVAIGAVVITAAMFAAAAVPIGDPQGRCAVVAVALGLFAVFTTDRLAVSAIVLPTWMIMNGFLVNHLGDLSWHGWGDLDRFLALVAAGVIGLAIGAAHQRIRELRERWRLGAAVQEMRTEFNKETKRA